jgi:hypothetical protein
MKVGATQAVAASGTDLEHAGALRDQESVNRLEQPVVGPVPATPAALVSREAVEEGRNEAKVLVLRPRGRPDS